MKKIFVLIALFVYGNVFAVTLSEPEQNIIDRVNKDFDGALALLERVVNINSGTLNQAGVRQVGDIFAKQFKAIGFGTRWVSMPPEMKRGGHLFAERRGKQGKRLLLIGHLDTVFEKDTPFQAFTRKDSRARGQGVNDMKGGDIVILYALKALQEAGALENCRIIVAFMGDEEKPGDPKSIARKDLVEAAKRSGIALGFETAQSMDTATVARRGVSTWLLKVTGPQAHSSGIFSAESGSGAVFEAARVLSTFHEKLRGEKFLTFNPAVILGGTEVNYDAEQSRGTAFGKTNVIASNAIANGDLRFISEEQKKNAQERMKQIVTTGNLPKASAQITFNDEYPSMAPTNGNMQLLKVYDHVSQDLGYGKVEAYDPGGRGAADISFVASYVDCLDGLGVIGEGAHTTDEDIDLQTFPKIIQRTALFIYRLTR